MIRFAVGLGIVVFTLVLGIYKYLDLSGQYDAQVTALEEAMAKRSEGKDLNQRIRNVRLTSLNNKSAQKVEVQRMLDIGAPGMEWRFVGQPAVRGSKREMYRYTFRVSGPTTYAESQQLLDRMNRLPGMVPYRYCFACTQPPRDTPEELRMVVIEGYLYAYDADTLY